MSLITVAELRDALDDFPAEYYVHVLDPDGGWSPLASGGVGVSPAEEDSCPEELCID